MIDLSDMALFVEVVKAKGFGRAAASTGIPSSTLSRRVAVLEKALGLRLLNRTTRRVELTEAGRIYFERSKRIVEDARLVNDELGLMATKPSGTLRASLPVDFANYYLVPLIAEFAQLYPDIEFEFDLAPRQVDLIAEPYDVAIRIGPLPDSQLIGRQLALIRFHLYAAPPYLEKFGVPSEPQDLARHECLHMPGDRAWRLESGKQSREVQINGRFSINSNSMILHLSTLGFGIAMMPEMLVAEQLSKGQLVRILPSWQGLAKPVYALTVSRLLPAKTQLFIDFLRERLSAD